MNKLKRTIVFVGLTLLCNHVLAAEPPSTAERAYWSMIENQNHIGPFQSYLARYPNGAYAAKALAIIKKMNFTRIGSRKPSATTSVEKPAQTIIELPTTECGERAECKAPPDPVPVHDGQLDAATAKPPAPANPATAPDIKVIPKMSAAEKSALDLHFWTSIEDSNNPVLFKAYLKQFPNGTFAVIAREKLKSLKAGTANAGAAVVKTPKAQSANTPPAAMARSLVLSADGVGGITADTPFTLAAIQAALPGFSVKKGEIQFEEVSSSVFYVELNGKLVMVIEGNDANHVASFKVYHRLVTGPSGLHVGDSIAKVRTKVALGQCYWGGEEMEGKITCFPPQGSVNYIFIPPDTINAEDNSDLTPETMPATSLLTRFDWAAPEGEAPPQPAVMPRPAPSAAPTTTGLTAQQLLQQADAIMDRTYQMDVSLWDEEAAKALKLYRQAAKLGSAIAFYKIGFLYETGNGIAKDNNTAIRYYEKAAAKGYLDAYSQIMLVQNQFRNFKGLANTFFRFYRAAPTQALQEFQNTGYGTDVGRAIQKVLKKAGYYRGPLDGLIGPGTRKAIAAYVSGQPPQGSSSPKQTGGRDTSALAKKLQRQLRRINCYHGAIDGKWGSGTTFAMRQFNDFSGRRLVSGRPTAKALRIISGMQGPICIYD